MHRGNFPFSVHTIQYNGIKKGIFMKAKLNVYRVSYSYHSLEGETPALSNISFSVDAGEFLAVVGPSGCGKSTLLSLLCGLAKPESGYIQVNGTPIEHARNSIGYMLQKDHLLEWRSVLSNVSLGLEIQKKLTKDSQAELMQMLNAYGLGQFMDKLPSELSGGMRQRAALIRTLALKPDILLLDEPFSALDYQTRLSVCDDISSIIRKQQKTAVLVTHDLSEAISTADRIVILSSRPGKVKTILPITFEKGKNLSPMERRNTPEFSQYFQLIWKELKNDEISQAV